MATSPIGATIPPRWSPPPDADPAHEAEADADKDLDAAAHYQVGGEIARGGMGAIKRAVDKDICREVAVKFLLNNADDRQRARFVEEAQITGQLEHPNIVPIHQLGIDEDAVRSRQVIHRNLKPANIMVGDFGEVYVMDWDLAKVLGKADIPAAAAASTSGPRSL